MNVKKLNIIRLMRVEQIFVLIWIVSMLAMNVNKN